MSGTVSCTWTCCSPAECSEAVRHAARKVGLQLYEHKIQDNLYLLDVRKVDGEILPFMDVCALLLAELKL